MKLPISSIESTCALMGDEEYQKLSAALEQEPPVNVRLNGKFTDSLSCSSISGCTPWVAGGYHLNQRLMFISGSPFYVGHYYAQEASSMSVEQVLRRYVAVPVKMLDLCVASGGKSTYARGLLPDGSLLMVNEVICNRLQILVENPTRWGHPNVVATNNDLSNFSWVDSFFGVISANVPCSGEGTSRRDPGVIEKWSPENVEVCW